MGLSPVAAPRGKGWGCGILDQAKARVFPRRLYMAEAKTAVANKPVWVDLSTSDAAGARNFYSNLFGWKIDVNPDPQYGGYALAKQGDVDVAGIGPKQPGDPSPTSWSIYIGTTD